VTFVTKASRQLPKVTRHLISSGCPTKSEHVGAFQPSLKRSGEESSKVQQRWGGTRVLQLGLLWRANLAFFSRLLVVARGSAFPPSLTSERFLSIFLWWPGRESTKHRYKRLSGISEVGYSKAWPKVRGLRKGKRLGWLCPHATPFFWIGR